jgi:hypothetical protein
LVLRTDSNGDTLWTRTLAGSDNTWDRFTSVKETTDGDLVLTGEVNFGGPWVVKMNSSGDTLWTKDYHQGVGTDIEELSQGGYLLCTGYSTLELGLFRLDTAGDTLWTMSLGGLAYDFDEGYSLEQTSDGGFIVGGSRDCMIDEGGGCVTPHLWLVRLGPEGTSGVPEESPPMVTARLQAHPNPFRSSVTISYEIPRDGPYRLAVHDVQGRLLNVLTEGFLRAGSRVAEWDGRDRSGERAKPGVYFIRLSGAVDSVPEKVVFQP